MFVKSAVILAGVYRVRDLENFPYQQCAHSGFAKLIFDIQTDTKTSPVSYPSLSVLFQGEV